MLFRKPKPIVDNTSFSRWLRAQRPPWDVFFTLGELEQEQMALLGDEQREIDAYTLAAVLRGEDQLVEAPVAETDRALALAKSFAERITQARSPVERPGPKHSLAGFGDRQEAKRIAERDDRESVGVHLFNRPPDRREEA